jgi:Ulp1 family protease
LFTSHFYSKLIEDSGAKHVSNWLARRNNFRIFEKRIIYFPINSEKHWSLCVANSPSKVHEMVSSGFSGTNEVPVILRLDSLKLHNSSVIAENIRMFFSYQWQQQFPFDSYNFTKINYPIIYPKGKFLCHLHHFNVVSFITNVASFLCFVVPSQLNRYNCGLFVCHYAAGLHKIRHELFTYTDIYSTSSPLLEKVTLNYNFQSD